MSWMIPIFLSVGANPVPSKTHFLYFTRLSGTEAEGHAVAEILGVSPFVSHLALEGILRQCSSPAVLHIATHGFFLPDQGSDPSLVSGFGTSPEQASSIQTENPLLRSGLALAGANTWLAGAALPSEAGDGLLTAEDVSAMDLTNTQLVVLSACETGVGKIEAGEGVLGLRRSFKLAGARSLVMSLWKVPDAQTAHLMKEFYRHVKSGVGCAQALRRAQLTLKCRHSIPYFWGAFVCEGNPGPINFDFTDASSS
jgi:CHAT domain-containing protein